MCVAQLDRALGYGPVSYTHLDVYKRQGRVREFKPYWPAVSMAVADVINQVILEEDQEDTLENLEKKIETIREAHYE